MARQVETDTKHYGPVPLEDTQLVHCRTTCQELRGLDPHHVLHHLLLLLMPEGGETDDGPSVV